MASARIGGESEDGRDDHGGANQSAQLVADSNGNTVVAHVSGLRHAHSVSIQQAPASAGGPSRLSEGLQPHFGIAEIFGLDLEHGLIGGADTVGRESEDDVQGQSDAEDEQAGDDDLAHALYAGLNAEVQGTAGANDGDDLEQDLLSGAGLEGSPQSLSFVDGQGLGAQTGDGSHQVLDAPTDDHAVVSSGHDQDDSAGGAQPGPFLAHVIAEAADMGAASGLSDSALSDQKRDGPDKQSHDPSQDKGTGAPGSNHAGETPNVTGTNSHTQGSENKTNSTAPSFILFSH